jgi:hypothetical protein
LEEAKSGRMLKLLQDVKSLEEAKSSFRMLIAWKKPRAAEGKSIVMRCGCCSYNMLPCEISRIATGWQNKKSR